MKSIKILYIEDDLLTAENVIEFLEDKKFKVFHTDTIVDALAQVKINSYDIVLLDLNLQDYSGFEFLKNLKKSQHIPIIVISALSETSVKLQAFRYGASDYIVKPIDLLELEARIWAVLGRFSQVKLDSEDEIFFIKDGNIYFDNKMLEFTPIEDEIFRILLKNRNCVVSREHFVDCITSLSSSRTLDYHIKNINSCQVSRSEYLSNFEAVLGKGE